MSTLQSEKARLESEFGEKIHEKEKKIVKLETQVKMGGNVLNALSMGMQMGKRSTGACETPRPCLSTGGASASSGSTATTAPEPLQNLFAVASPD